MHYQPEEMMFVFNLVDFDESGAVNVEEFGYPP